MNAPQDKQDFQPLDTEHTATRNISDEGAPEIKREAELTDEERASVKERIDTAINDTARKLREIASQFERSASPGTQVDEYTNKVATQLRRSASYLESTNVDTTVGRVEKTIRQNPLPSLGVAFGVGFVIARVLKR